jgi:hypothetical protein
MGRKSVRQCPRDYGARKVTCVRPLLFLYSTNGRDFRWRANAARAVQPIHPVGWGDQMPPVRLAPGLAYVSTAQIHPWPVFNDEVVRNVDRSLATVLEVLREG